MMSSGFIQPPYLKHPLYLGKEGKGMESEGRPSRAEISPDCRLDFKDHHRWGGLVLVQRIWLESRGAA